MQNIRNHERLRSCFRDGGGKSWYNYISMTQCGANCPVKTLKNLESFSNARCRLSEWL